MNSYGPSKSGKLISVTWSVWSRGVKDISYIFGTSSIYIGFAEIWSFVRVLVGF
jgi:hypothetical protein